MDQSFIEKICGSFPPNFIEPIITDNTYIFENDPSFQPINLYNFLGQGATVNSFKECFYYVSQGWEPDKTTFVDIGIQILPFIVTSFLIYVFLKKNIYKLIINKLKNINKGGLREKSYIFFNKKRINNLLFIFFVLQTFFTFDVVRTKAVRLKPFIDEYISLTSNVNFFRTLNFYAGDFIGGNYSVSLTSGPLSSIGAVIGWNISNKLAIARISNFYWVYFLQIILVLLIGKYYKKNIKFLLITSNFILLLFPWWFGSLYSIGEIASLVLFTNAIFLFSKARYISIFLFSLSIIFGKLLNLVPFAGFYIVVLLSEKNFKKVFSDFVIFCIPLVSWLSLVNSRYVNGNFVQYLFDQFNFIVNHQSSGAEIKEESLYVNVFDSVFAGEFVSWNIYDRIRLIIIPLVFIFLIYRNKEKINNIFGNISYPFISSIFFSYSWFWLLNTTKWIRYSQHFIVLVLIGIFTLLTFKVFDKKFDLYLSIIVIAVFIENFKLLIIVLCFISFFIIYKTKSSANYNLIYLTLSIIIFIDFALPFYEKETLGNVNNIIDECKKDLTTIGCFDAYINQ
tara:strand:+ start:1899 stop:3593 length:1695 start_codon:yes stop_codon:yes gene_type:complete